jgi:hypothetical protein
MVALRQEDERIEPVRRRGDLGSRRLRVVPAEPLALVRRDTLPEHADYRDAGCELSVSCLHCPLVRCQYDEPAFARRKLAIDARDREIALLRRRHRAPIDTLAETYGLTRRSIFRILRAQA